MEILHESSNHQDSDKQDVKASLDRKPMSMANKSSLRRLNDLDLTDN